MNNELIRNIVSHIKERVDVEEDNWTGNYKYVTDLRNQFTHRFSSQVSLLAGPVMSIADSPIYTLRRVVEEYVYVNNMTNDIVRLIIGPGDNK